MNHTDAIKEWDLTIEPQSSLFKLNLKDVWCYRDLLVMFVKRDFVSFYKQTILGPLWFFIQPLFTTIVFNRFFIELNSITGIIEGFKYSILGKGELTMFSFGYSALFTLSALLIGIMIFNKTEKTFVDTV